MQDRIKEIDGVVDVTTDRDQGGLQANVVIDRNAASRLGVRIQDNVICAADEKVVYTADWSSLADPGEARSAAVDEPMHVKRLHATILHQMGLDPNRLSYFYSGLDQKLVGVEEVEIIKQVA